MAVKKTSYSSGVGNVGIDFGKIPPQALDLEEAVLGAVMLEKDAILQIIDLLRPESFYKEEHQKIFQAIIDLTSGNRAIDLLTVTEELRKKKQLDEWYIRNASFGLDLRILVMTVRFIVTGERSIVTNERAAEEPESTPVPAVATNRIGIE